MTTALQPLRITDLPPEILREIFDYFTDARMDRPGRVDWFYNHSTYADLPEKRQAVYHSRLVCRRFRDLANPLLLPTVRVKLEQASLDRLDEISRNAAVAASVRGIEVALASRLRRPAADLLAFITRRKLDILEDPRRAEIELAWNEYLADPLADDSQLSEYQVLLRESHREYGRLFRDQERLLSSGAFVDAIATAASRMPLFGSLLFDDSDIYAGHLTEEEREAPPLRHRMTSAEKWWTIEATVPGFLPGHVLADLPIAIDKAGVRLREIGVNCFPMATNWAPVRDPDALRSACRHLEEVNYWPLDNTAAGYTISGQRNLHLYLQCVLSGHFMEVLSIDGRGFSGGGTVPRTVLGPALGTLDGSRLTAVSVEHAAFEQQVWDGFCAGLGSQMEWVSFQYIRLVDDASWGPSLGVLRQKTASRCEEAKCTVQLYRLSGGEFAGDGAHVYVTNWWDLYGKEAFQIPGGTDQ